MLPIFPSAFLNPLNYTQEFCILRGRRNFFPNSFSLCDLARSSLFSCLPYQLTFHPHSYSFCFPVRSPVFLGNSLLRGLSPPLSLPFCCSQLCAQALSFLVPLQPWFLSPSRIKEVAVFFQCFRFLSTSIPAKPKGLPSPTPSCVGQALLNTKLVEFSFPFRFFPSRPPVKTR